MGTTAERFVPDTTSLESLASAAQACEGCGLYRNATQAAGCELLADLKVAAKAA